MKRVSALVVLWLSINMGQFLESLKSSESQNYKKCGEIKHYFQFFKVPGPSIEKHCTRSCYHMIERIGLQIKIFYRRLEKRTRRRDIHHMV